MKIIDSLRTLFDVNILDGSGKVQFTENDVLATVNHLIIQANGTSVFYADENFSKTFERAFRRGCSCRGNADGIVFGDDKKIVICELKSSIGNLQKAIRQAKSTFVKLIMGLNICEDFVIGDYKFFILITCKEDSNLLSTMNTIGQLPVNRRKPVESIFYEVFSNHRKMFLMKDLVFSPEINQNILNVPVTILLCTTSTDTVTVDYNAI